MSDTAVGHKIIDGILQPSGRRRDGFNGDGGGVPGGSHGGGFPGGYQGGYPSYGYPGYPGSGGGCPGTEGPFPPKQEACSGGRDIPTNAQRWLAGWKDRSDPSFPERFLRRTAITPPELEDSGADMYACTDDEQRAVCHQVCSRLKAAYNKRKDEHRGSRQAASGRAPAGHPYLVPMTWNLAGAM